MSQPDKGLWCRLNLIWWFYRSFLKWQPCKSSRCLLLLRCRFPFFLVYQCYLFPLTISSVFTKIPLDRCRLPVLVSKDRSKAFTAEVTCAHTAIYWILECSTPTMEWTNGNWIEPKTCSQQAKLYKAFLNPMDPLLGQSLQNIDQTHQILFYIVVKKVSNCAVERCIKLWITHFFPSNAMVQT